MRFEIRDITWSVEFYKVEYIITDYGVTMHVRVPLEEWNENVEAMVRADMANHIELCNQLKVLRDKYIGESFEYEVEA